MPVQFPQSLRFQRDNRGRNPGCDWEVAGIDLCEGPAPSWRTGNIDLRQFIDVGAVAFQHPVRTIDVR